MKQLLKINLKQILTKICVIGALVLAFFGTINFSSVKAEELPVFSEEVKVYSWYQEIYKLPDTIDKSFWFENRIMKDDTFAGRWYRFKKTSSTIVMFNVRYKFNDELRHTSVMYYSDQNRIAFGRFSIEYKEVVINEETYLEFYIPETFDCKYRLDGYSTVYEDYFDNTYSIIYYNSLADVVTLSEFEELEFEITQGEVETPENSIVESEEDLNFIEKIGEKVSEFFNFSDANLLLVGSLTLLSGLIVVALLIFLLYFFVFRKL